MSNTTTQDSETPTATSVPSDVQDIKPQTISQRLFPDMISGPEETPDTETETVDPGTEAPPIVEAPPETQAPPAPAQSDVIDIAAFQGKKVRVKIDGEEMEVPAESLLKNYQLDAHLTRKGQQLGEQRRALEDLRKELLDKTKEDTEALETAVDEGEAPSEIKKLEVQLQETQRQLAEVRGLTADIGFQKNVAVLDAQVKSSLGFDDFKAYVPKIQEFIRGQLADPERPTPQEARLYDTREFYLQKYQEMKLRELRQAPPAPPPAPPAAAPTAPKLVKIMPVESAGGGLPSQANAAQEQKLQQAFSRAKASGSQSDWADYIALKRTA